MQNPLLLEPLADGALDPRFSSANINPTAAKTRRQKPTFTFDRRKSLTSPAAYTTLSGLKPKVNYSGYKDLCEKTQQRLCAFDTQQLRALPLFLLASIANLPQLDSFSPLQQTLTATAQPQRP